MKKYLTFFSLLLIALSMSAQRNEIYQPHIATLQVVAADRWLSPPVIQLNKKEVIHIDFDDFTHEYHRYSYKLEHCEADWTTSEDLFLSDYIDGFSEGNIIDDVNESINTNVLYTHYSFSVPNRECIIKMSGNYRLTVYDENKDNEKILSVCFMVVEPTFGVSMEVSGNTDIDSHHAHQQVSLQVNYGNIIVSDAMKQIKTVILQNMRWDNAVINPRPQYIMPNGLKWFHNKDMIFRAGNEFHKFEILDVNHPTMGIDRISWEEGDYHVWSFTDTPRLNYLYDEDANGAFYIRNSDNIENNRTSEYVYVHYTLSCPKPIKGDVFVNGWWTNQQFSPKYKMNYNFENKCYEAIIKQKQGYYSYQYLKVDTNGSIKEMDTEGSFYQTENKYYAFVYYRGPGERTDRLLGYQEVQYK